ncbi:hypothetical protein [Clostridium tagluense]|nr:hypothetical protein [Clostridium tagluense]
MMLLKSYRHTNNDDEVSKELVTHSTFSHKITIEIFKFIIYD